MTDLILWRHAEAEGISPSGNDVDRRLSEQGRRDATAMAEWLDQCLPADTVVWCSPAQRCRETVTPYSALRQFNIIFADVLGVDSDVEHLYSAVCHQQSAQALLIIGHEPNLGALLGRLTKTQNMTHSVNKGEVWWLRPSLGDDTLQYAVYRVQSPRAVFSPE